jgi:bifunctional UDP-N-acetylglucosamine pyrophosphorylase/glucosamine-1-phosphate N-acetyltransferase
MQAVIFAAGKGVRLKPITDIIPKCMVKIKGKPLMEWILDTITSLGIEEIYLIVGYKKEIIENYFGQEYKGAKINYIVQKEQMGTAHALSLAEKFAKKTFLVINSDVLIGKNDMKKAIETDEFDQADAIILGKKVTNPWRFGVLKTEGNKIIDIVEKPKIGEEPSNLINSGIYRFDPDIFKAIKETNKSIRGEFELVESIKKYIAKGKNVEYRMIEGMFIHISDIEDLKKANSIPDDEFLA